jgi:hypothetical protein
MIRPMASALIIPVGTYRIRPPICWSSNGSIDEYTRPHSAKLGYGSCGDMPISVPTAIWGKVIRNAGVARVKKPTGAGGFGRGPSTRN